MKNVLFATSAIVAFTAGGAAFADAHAAGVSTSAEARLGLVYLDDGDDATDDLFGTSRIRVKFAGTGTSDNGLTFGFNVRADNAVGGQGQDGVEFNPDGTAADPQSPGVGTDGDVFISGSFGTLTYGDTDTGVENRVGHPDQISLTGLGDRQEISRGGILNPQIRYDYDFDSFGFSISTQGNLEEIAVGVGGSFAIGANSIGFGLGYDTTDETIAAALNASFGAVTAKVAFSTSDDNGDDISGSLKYVSGPLSVAGFVSSLEDAGTDSVLSYGLGMGYDMGGGLELKTGIAANDDDVITADLGFLMTF